MKKLTLKLGVFLIALLLTGTLSSSSYVTFSGSYENEQIKLEVFNSQAAWLTRRGGGSSYQIKFTITAKPGYQLYGKYNRIVYYGIRFTFKPENSNGESFQKGIAEAEGSFMKSSEFDLIYIAVKTGESNRKYVTKKLKMVMERPARGSHDNVKILISEIQ